MSFAKRILAVFPLQNGVFSLYWHRRQSPVNGCRPFLKGRGKKMSQIQPEGEEIRKAIKWISDNLNEGKKKSKLIEEAAIKYDLSPAQTDFLMNFFSK
jgi:hypothetical protein